MTKLAKHGAKVIKMQNELAPSSKSFEGRNIWFNWGDKDSHVVRLVGDFRWVRSHWIGKSSFNPKNDVELFVPEAFKGVEKLPYKVNCGNWNIALEAEEGDNCVICQIGRIAQEALKKEGKGLDEERRQWLKNIVSKCNPNSSYYFKCIDRSDPFIADNVKGFKILQMSTELLTAVVDLDKSLEDVSITSEEDGIDIEIKRERIQASSRIKYSVSPVFKGVSVKQTPLTDEEKSWDDLDLMKFTGRPVDDGMLIEKMNPLIKTIWGGDSYDEDEGSPF